MILFIRSAAIGGGKVEAATEWAKEIAGLLGEKYGHEVMVYQGAFGDFGKIVWVAHYESLAHLEQMTGRYLSDADYMGMIQAATEEGLFIPGSVIDQVFNAV